MTYLQKLTQFRELMKQQDIQGYIIPSSDPHISEYLPEHYKAMAYLSGFTGSAGTLVITQDFAGLWADSRYFVQANEQLQDTGFELVKLKVQNAPEFVDYLAQNLPAGSTVGFDGNCASLALADAVIQGLTSFDIKVEAHVDLIDQLWSDRPALPAKAAYSLPVSTTGCATDQKLAQVREVMKQKRVFAHVISSLDDIAWLLNIRGTDVKCNPVTLSFVYLEQEKAILFINPAKLSAETTQELNDFGVEILPYQDFQDYLKQLPKAQRVLVDPKRTCFSTFDILNSSQQVVEDLNPSTLLKSVKNQTEIQHQRDAMVYDGVALTKFFMWLEQNVGSQALTEISIAEHLQKLRSEQPGFKDISFDTIAGYKDHGALPHYKAEEHSNYTLAPEGLLLVDSGGQYQTGTTDITRVVSLGKLTQEQKEDYTIVLKGTIEGSMAIFTKGTRGYQIDAITRRPIWATLRNYGHGTGHGVGFFLNVHEGPHTFNGAAIDIPILSGMISSIEPGLYREGQYGIRIENLVVAQDLAQNEFGDFMDFETITLCYIATDLVEKSLLDQTHIDWLNTYNQTVYDKVSPHLTYEEAMWLEQKTQAI